MTEKTDERKAVPEKVTAFELARMLNHMESTQIESAEIGQLARDSNLLIVISEQERFHEFFRTFFVLRGKIEARYRSHIPNNPELLITREGVLSAWDWQNNGYFARASSSIRVIAEQAQNPRFHQRLLSLTPSVIFEYSGVNEDDEGRRWLNAATGLVIDMSVFDDLEREAKLREVAS